ncbi:hypothetical protein MXAZACID_07688 [Acidocella sp. MX-AZ02]|nr:hypothetical protein MXAZACID_07688 [Acidocella sp. MX-AZ02]
MQDLREYLARLEKWFARPITAGEHPTLYTESSSSRQLICGIQRDDYMFSGDGKWILPSRCHGLSFSAHWQHLKGIHRLKSKRNPGKQISVYWVLSEMDLPDGLEFVADEKDPQHYLLCVTATMRVEELRDKLIRLGDRMAVIRDAQVAL